MNAPSSSGAAPVAPVRTPLVVAVDASAAAGPTIAWATAEATARQAPVRTVSFGLRDDGDEHRRLELREALVDTSSSALVIVGATTSGAATRWLRTEVPGLTSRRNSCPIVVVRGDAHQPLRRIVVGVGDPPEADAALDWAADEARRHDAELVVVHAWRPASGLDRSIRGKELARSDARCVVDRAVRHCEMRTDRPARGELVEGDAASTLSSASRDADLVVVGSRGSGYRTMLFGTVALLVVEQAGCPVALVPPTLRTARAGRAAAAQ